MVASVIKRNLSTPKARAFWASAEANAADVETWPAWKRAGINVASTRSEPRASLSEDVGRRCPAVRKGRYRCASSADCSGY